MASEPKPFAAQTPDVPAQPPQPTEFPLDRSQLTSAYTNYCQVIGLPEELLLDFGLNSSGDSTSPQSIHMNHQVVLNYYTAKRLLNALAFAVNRHENFFGALEVDVQRRIRTGALASPPGR